MQQICSKCAVIMLHVLKYCSSLQHDYQSPNVFHKHSDQREKMNLRKKNTIFDVCYKCAASMLQLCYMCYLKRAHDHQALNLNAYVLEDQRERLIFKRKTQFCKKFQKSAVKVLQLCCNMQQHAKKPSRGLSRTNCDCSWTLNLFLGIYSVLEWTICYVLSLRKKCLQIRK